LNPVHKIPKFNFIKESFRFESVTVATNTRRIRATWTPELAQDLQAFHGIDVEAELTALLSQEIAREIDREIINTITQDLVAVQPLDLPRGDLFYFDFVYDQNIKEPVVYSDGSWSLGNTFESSIGFKIEIKPFKFI
jgi:hypothetical protein